MLEHQFKKSSLYVIIPAAMLLLAGLYLLSFFNYLFYHTLIELFSIIIALTIFVIGWNTQKYSRNNMFIILATGFLVVASLDLLHTLAYRGMGVFPQYDANLSTQFWIAARYVQAAAFFLAALYLGGGKQIRPKAWLYAFLTAGAVLTYAVFAGYFPDSFVEGEGLTTFKIVSEYVISAILVAAGIILWEKRTYLEKNILSLLLLAVSFNILSEMSLTLYVDVYGFFNFLGHIFKLFSMAFIYRALIYESLTNPFQLLFKEVAAANEKLTQNEKKFRDLVEQSTDWVWEVDLTGKLSYSNPRAQELTGYALEEILGKALFDFMDIDSAGRNRHYFFKSASRCEPFYRFENTMLHKNGEAIVFETNGTPIVNEQGKLTGYRGVARDITERKQAEQALIQSCEEIEQANRAKTQFLANMSHEVRTPMNIIMGMTGLLQNSELNPTQQEWAEMVREAAASLLAMMNDILDYSRIESSRLELIQVSFQLSREVKKIVSSFAPHVQKKGLKLTCHIDQEIPSVVIGNPARLRQVLSKLLDNAIKFTEQGEIVVSLHPVITEKNGEAGEAAGLERSNIYAVHFSIRDTGIGIPPDQVNRLFEKFTQVDVSDTRRYEGAGLGLALSQKLVELMGGSIGVKSIEDRGSTFYFTIPFILPPYPAAPGEASGNEQPLWRGNNGMEIMLVEDKPMNQKLATLLLEKEGYRVTTASNGKEALELHRTRSFDLILMDIQMPLMDGLEATAQIRAAEAAGNGHTPIIAMTAYAMQEDRDKCLQAGMDFYISKPIDTEELYCALARVMKKDANGPLTQALPAEDVKEMLQRVEGSIELLEELLQMFFQDFHQDRLVVKESLEKQDARALAAVMHGLKGELGNLGMHTAYQIACELENLAKENKFEAAASLARLLEDEIRRLEQFFAHTPGGRS